MKHLAVLLILLTVGLSGCGIVKTELDKCYEQREYQEARPGPRVRIPEDLTAPPPEAWVPVPYGEANTTATPDGDPCLIEPPDFRDTQRN